VARATRRQRIGFARCDFTRRPLSSNPSSIAGTSFRRRPLQLHLTSNNSLLLVVEPQAEDVAEGNEGALGGIGFSGLDAVLDRLSNRRAEPAMTIAALAHHLAGAVRRIGCARIAAIEHSRRKLAGLRERAGQHVLQRRWAHDENREDIFEHLHDARVELGACCHSISPGPTG
jgi:hypothetical protein